MIIIGHAKNDSRYGSICAQRYVVLLNGHRSVVNASIDEPVTSAVEEERGENGQRCWLRTTLTPFAPAAIPCP